MKNWGHIVREETMKNWGHIVNCGHYNKLWGLRNIRWGTRVCNWDFFIKTKLYKLEGNKSLVKE